MQIIAINAKLEYQNQTTSYNAYLNVNIDERCHQEASQELLSNAGTD